MNADNWTEEELLSLEHGDPREMFLRYLKGDRHARDKQDFLFSWISPQKDDFILECGSSSGRTSFDLARRSGCRTLGIDFDPEAVEVSRQMRDTHFPQLKDRCRFEKDDLAKMEFSADITKVIMPDFTEHVPDSILAGILANIGRQLPNVRLYVYTPSRTHLFEKMKRRNFILKNPSGHINVKTESELKNCLRDGGWRIIDARWRPSHFPVFRLAESLLGRLPLIGPLFRRRIAIVAAPSLDLARGGELIEPLSAGAGQPKH